LFPGSDFIPSFGIFHFLASRLDKSRGRTIISSGIPEHILMRAIVSSLCALIYLALAQPFALLGATGALGVLSLRDTSQTPPSGGNGDSRNPVISYNGRQVLFSSSATDLVVNETNNTPLRASFPARLNVFLRNTTTGTTTLISVNTNASAGGNGDSLPSAISTNGQFMLFESDANDLVPGDSNGIGDIFIRDVLNGSTSLVSVGTNGSNANGSSRDAVMTPDGRYVAFVSAASNLVENDTNGTRIFLFATCRPARP
jgi:Tol biopolymer transport system component